MKHGTIGDGGPPKSVGVVLFQLGGPDSPEAIEPFLYNLFSDPDIIDFPFAQLARPTLARLISSRRARHVREHYARIGGRSPIRELTERQAAALEVELRKTTDVRCFVAMRYWNPSTADAIRQVRARRFDQLVLLPLYPQYSKTTTGSSFNEWRRQYGAVPNRSEVRVISDFHVHPLYIDAVVEKINLGLESFQYQTRSERSQSGPLSLGAEPTGHRPTSPDPPALRMSGPLPLEGEFRESAGVAPRKSDPLPLGGEGVRLGRTGEGVPNFTGPKPFRSAPGEASADDVHLIFSAHGVPLKEIEQGDPYQKQIEGTVRSVIERGQWPNPHCLCYQSRVGPGKWLGPSLEHTLRRLAAEGTRRALVIPISFVTDHVETLHEIGIEARHLAEKLGLGQFEVMPALNDSPAFIRALADIVSKALASETAGTCHTSVPDALGHDHVSPFRTHS